MRGNRNGTCKNSLAKWENPFIIFQRVKKSQETLFLKPQLARLSYVNDVISVSVSFNSPDSSCSLSSTYVLFAIFVNVGGLEGRKAHDYLRMFYIIYNNYCKQILIYIFLFIPVFDSFRSSCWLSSMLDQESKTLVILSNMSHCAACFMSSVFLTFIRHMSGKCFYFGILCFILNRKNLKLSDETLI
jgi:hypothetical protein